MWNAWHVARNSCAGTAAHSTRLPQQRRQRRGTAAHSTRLQQQLRQHRGTAAALDSFLALWNQGVLCLASLSQGAFHFRCQLASRARPGCSWPPSGSTWTSTATRPAGCMLSAVSAFPRLWLVQLGTSHGLVQLGRRMPERRETCSCASRGGRVAAQKQWTSFFAYFPVLSPTHARAVVPRQPGAGHPQSFPS